MMMVKMMKMMKVVIGVMMKNEEGVMRRKTMMKIMKR